MHGMWNDSFEQVIVFINNGRPPVGVGARLQQERIG